MENLLQFLNELLNYVPHYSMKYFQLNMMDIEINIFSLNVTDILF